MKKACSVFYTLPTHTLWNQPYSSSNIKAARLPARPHTVEYSSLLRRRPTSAKPRIPLIFHSTSSFLSWHSRKRSGSIRLGGSSSATFSRCGAESHHHRDPFRCLQECLLLYDILYSLFGSLTNKKSATFLPPTYKCCCKSNSWGVFLLPYFKLKASATQKSM